MAIKMMKSMKGIDLSCNSPSSTAICTTADHRSMVRNSTTTTNKPALHRLNTYFSDHYKYSKPPCSSSSSHLPFTPRPHYAVSHSDLVSRRKSSADVSDLRRLHKSRTITTCYSPPTHSSRYLLGDSDSSFLDSTSSETETSSALVPSTPVTLPEIRRSETAGRRLGLLMDAEREKAMKKKTTSLGMVNYNHSDQRMMMVDQYNNNNNKHDKRVIKDINYGDNYSQRQRSMGRNCNNKNDSDSPAALVKSSSSSSARSRHQVVVLRVSLHCKGCVGKLKKHLSKMEGVTSFSIDLETKKVTVIGNVTPLGVLTSISKVKNAQFWPSPASASSSSSSSSTSSSSTSSSTLEDFTY